METNGDFLKLVKAKLSQKYFEEVKTSVENGEEVDDSVFDIADFNGDGKVTDDDKNLFEEYINKYENVFGGLENGTQSIEDILNGLNSDTDNDGAVSDGEASFASLIQNALQSYSENPDGFSLDNLVSTVSNGKNTDGKVDSAKLQELKEQCLEIQQEWSEAKAKYEKALENKKTAESRRQSFLTKYENKKSSYESARSSYDEIVRKKMNESSKSGNSKNSKSNSRIEQQLSEAKRKRDKASREMNSAFSDYSLAGSNVTFYDNSANMHKAQYEKLTESYSALAGEFGTMYDSLSDAEKAQFGENPFLADFADDSSSQS